MSLSKGARILILEKSGNGWWKGQYGNKIGWFPSNYTQEELTDEPISSAIVKYNYQAQQLDQEETQNIKNSTQKLSENVDKEISSNQQQPISNSYQCSIM